MGGPVLIRSRGVPHCARRMCVLEPSKLRPIFLCQAKSTDDVSWGIQLRFGVWFAHHSLTTFRCHGSPCGRGLGEVGQFIYSDLPLTHSPICSSKWARLVVMTAWVGTFGGALVLSALFAQGYSKGPLIQSTLHTF